MQTHDVPASAADSAQSSEPPPRIPRHRYPLPIVLAGVVTLAAAVYSFTLAPQLVSAQHDLTAGRRALKSGDYVGAAAKLARAHREAPTSRDVTVSLAEAEFASGQGNSAMELLRNVKLTQSEWTELQIYMPETYQQYFRPVS
jgi:hypothetical protein